MNRRQIDIKKLLIPGDSIAFIVIIVGLIIAIFIDELAIRLIGVSTSILGIVAIVMLLSQRLSVIVDSNKYKANISTHNFSVTTKKEGEFKRQTIENFDSSFGPDDIQEIEIEEKEPDLKKVDEGFKIVGKSAVNNISKKEDSIKPEFKPHFESRFSQKSSEENNKQEFTDDFSGVRIIGKTKTRPETHSTEKESQTVPDNFILKNKFEDRKETANKASEQKQKFDTEPKYKKEKEAYTKIPTIKKDFDDNKNITDTAPIKKEKDSTTELNPLGYKGKKLDIPLSMLMENEPVFGQEPKKEFDYFLKRVLTVIRSVTSTRTAAFLLINNEKQELVLSAYVSDKPESIITKRKFPISKDIVSQIITNVKAEILTEISPSAELDLFPYYSSPAGISSFIGAPVFMGDSVIGVLCADSTENNAYDSTIVEFIGHFTKLIGVLMHSYTEKYELKIAARTLETIKLLRNISLNHNNSGADFFMSILEALERLFDFSTAGICGYDEKLNIWKIKFINSKNDTEKINYNQPISIEESYIGDSILRGKTVYISPLEKGILRVFPEEEKFQTGFFVSVPLASTNNNYGALFLEGNNPSAFYPGDIEILQTLAEHAGACIDNIQNTQTNTYFTDNYIHDTGTINPGIFYQKLDHELMRSIDYNQPLTLCFLKIDKYHSFNPSLFKEREEPVLQHVLNIVRNRLRAYDLFGRIDSDLIAIGLIGVSLHDAKIWAERLRSEIAISVLEIKTKRFTVTVSIGLADNNQVEDFEELLDNATKVLDLSIQKTNCVTIFN